MATNPFTVTNAIHVDEFHSDDLFNSYDFLFFFRAAMFWSDDFLDGDEFEMQRRHCTQHESLYSDKSHSRQRFFDSGDVV